MVATIAQVKAENPVGTPDGELTKSELKALVPNASELTATIPPWLGHGQDINNADLLSSVLDPTADAELLALRKGIKDTYGEKDAARFDNLLVDAIRASTAAKVQADAPALLAKADAVDVSTLDMDATYAVYRATHEGQTATEKVSAIITQINAPGFQGDTKAIENALGLVMTAGMTGQPPEVVEQVAQKVLNKLLQQGPAAIERGLVDAINANDLSGVPQESKKDIADILQAAKNQKLSPQDTMVFLLTSIEDLETLDWQDNGIGNLNWVISAGEGSGLPPEAMDRLAAAAIAKLKAGAGLPEPDRYAGFTSAEKWDKQDAEQGIQMPTTFIGKLAWVLGHICQDRQDDVEENLKFITSEDMRVDIDQKTGIDKSGNRDRTQVALSVLNASVQEYTMMTGLAKSIIDGMGQGMNKMAG